MSYFAMISLVVKSVREIWPRCHPDKEVKHLFFTCRQGSWETDRIFWKKNLFERVSIIKKKTGEGQFQPTLQQRNRHQSALRPHQLRKSPTCIRLSAEPYVFMIWLPKLRKRTRMSNVSLSIVCTCCSTSKFRPSWAFVYCLLTFLPLARL